MKHLVFWQNIPSILQAPFIRAVAERWSGTVTTVTESDVSPERLSQGWSRPNFGSSELIIAPDGKRREDLIQGFGHEEATHIFSGLRAYRETMWTMTRVSRTEATISVFLEPLAKHDGLRTIVRRQAYRAILLRWRRRLDLMLVTGTRGLDEYVRLGVPAHRVFPFAYTVNGTGDTDRPEAGERMWDDRVVRLLFVGSLVRRKGVDLLLGALGGMQDEAWTLDVIGNGPLRDDLGRLCDSEGLSDRVQWLGNLPNHEVRSRMQNIDILVLPSRFDGWGAVVNEALLSGARVVVSDACGSADLVTAHSSRGGVFRAGDVADLRSKLSALVAEGLLPENQRQAIRGWAESRIAPPAVADYFLSVLASIRDRAEAPTAPWLAPEPEAQYSEESSP